MVSDTGIYCDENIQTYLKGNVKFLTPVKTSQEWVLKELDAHRDKLKTMSSLCPWDTGIHGITVPIIKKFPDVLQQKENGNGAQAEETQSQSYKLYLHLFLDSANVVRDEKRLAEKVFGLRDKVLRHDGNLSEKESREIQQYLILSKVGRAGQLHVSFNEEACREAKKYSGFFALVSNKTSNAFEALKIYRLREKFEECFHAPKQIEELGTEQVQYDDHLNGRLFCQFVALGYSLYWRYAIADLRKDLYSMKAQLPKEEREKYIALSNWLEAQSLTDILDWFDCIENTKLMGSKTSKIIEATTERDQLFLKLLLSKKRDEEQDNV